MPSVDPLPLDYSFARHTVPAYTSLRRVNHDFLTRIMKAANQDKYPVRFDFSRVDAEPNMSIIVTHAHDTLQLGGLGYHVYQRPGERLPYLGVGPIQASAAAAQPTPFETRGVVADGTVEVMVVSNNPDDRDRVMAQIIAAYLSSEGQCWFTNHPSVRIHGYKPVGRGELSFAQNFDGNPHQLFTAVLTLEFNYDIVTAEWYGWIKEIFGTAQLLSYQYDEADV